jgi:hypothetical protein
MDTASLPEAPLQTTVREEDHIATFRMSRRIQMHRQIVLASDLVVSAAVRQARRLFGLRHAAATTRFVWHRTSETLSRFWRVLDVFGTTTGICWTFVPSTRTARHHPFSVFVLLLPALIRHIRLRFDGFWMSVEGTEGFPEG